MKIKGLVPAYLVEGIIASKAKHYGDSASSIRMSFEVGNIIDEFTLPSNKTFKQLSDSVSMTELKDVTYNLRGDTMENLACLATEAGLPVISCLRAILAENAEKLKAPPVPVFTAPALTEPLIPHDNDSYVETVLKYWSKPDNSEPVEDACRGMYPAEDSHLDVANSSFKMYLLHHAIECNRKTRPLYRIDYANSRIEGDVAAAKEQPQYIHNLSKNVYASTLVNFLNEAMPHCGNRSRDKENLLSALLGNVIMQEYSKLSYSPAGIVPCPSDHYNEIKGIITWTDTLPEMLCVIAEWTRLSEEKKDNINKKIVAYNEHHKETILPSITDELIEGWAEWFTENREVAFLQDFYSAGENIQPALEFRLPVSIEAFNSYIDKLNTLVYARAYRLACHK